MNDTPPTRPNYFTGEALLTPIHRVASANAARLGRAAAQAARPDLLLSLRVIPDHAKRRHRMPNISTGVKRAKPARLTESRRRLRSRR